MDNGIRTVASSLHVDEIVQRLTDLLRRKEVKLFTIIDHSGEAKAVGMDMPDTKLLIFGNPKAGTPVMLSAPAAALDLPLKILVSAQQDDTTLLSWNDPAWLQQRHGFSSEFMANLAAAELLARQAAQ